jgi:hypothetical protein
MDWSGRIEIVNLAARIRLMSGFNRLAVFSRALTFVLGACAERPQRAPTRSWTKPCDDCIAGVENFAKVSPALWRGAQPSAAGFRSLAAAGAKTVVSLRARGDDFDLLAGTNLKYVRIQTSAWNPEEAPLALFIKIMENPDNWPVFVHCAQGRDRTGYAVALYRIAVENWSVDDALHEMFDFRFNRIWFRNPAFLRQLDVAQMRERARRAP